MCVCEVHMGGHLCILGIKFKFPSMASQQQSGCLWAYPHPFLCLALLEVLNILFLFKGSRGCRDLKRGRAAANSRGCCSEGKDLKLVWVQAASRAEFPWWAVRKGEHQEEPWVTGHSVKLQAAWRHFLKLGWIKDPFAGKCIYSSYPNTLLVWSKVSKLETITVVGSKAETPP